MTADGRPRFSLTAAGSTDAGSWDAFVASHPDAAIYHRYAWRSFLEAACGCQTYYLMARDGAGDVIGVLPLARLRSLLFGDFLVSLPYFTYGGPLAANPAVEEALLTEAASLARRLGVRHLELRETRARSSAWPVRTDKVSMRLPLRSTVAAQFAAFPAKLRSQIRRPQREGAMVQRGGSELLPGFYRVFARNMRDLGTPVYGRQFFRAILTAFPGDAEIVVVSINGEAVAAGLLLHWRGVTEIPWASSLRERNRTGANMLLYWEALQSAIGRGSVLFDFGRSTVDAGTYRFKAQWGAQPLPLHWHYWLPPGRRLPDLRPSNPRFALAIRAWQRLPVWAANRLGPTIVIRLP